VYKTRTGEDEDGEEELWKAEKESEDNSVILNLVFLFKSAT
jgi:hypothetical protein